MSTRSVDAKAHDRIVQFGEVFTPPQIVRDMLDLIKDESYRIESRVLEPACGDGAFLVELLNRKLATCRYLYAHDQTQYERHSLVAVAYIEARVKAI